MRHAGPEITLREYAQVVTPEMQGIRVRGFEGCGLDVARIPWQKTPGVMQSNEPKRLLGERGRTRTCDPCLKSVSLNVFSATYKLREPPKSL